MFEEIYNFLDKYDGFDSSFSAKRKYSGEKDTKKMTYGEFTSISFTDMINTLKKYMKLDGSENVIDLGSGMGKVIVALHYSGLFKNVYGVELLEGMYNDSLKLVEDYAKEFKKDVSNIKIMNNDLLKIKYSNYDTIITNTSVDDALLKGIVKKINSEAKKGAIVVSSISQLIAKNLNQLDRFSSKFSWGPSHINFALKL
jgi:protein-L-isoaspartate O-methyltransferase